MIAVSTEFYSTDVHRRYRDDVRRRHADVLSIGDATSTRSPDIGTARTHPRWEELVDVDDKKDDEHAQGEEEESESETILLGPAYIPSELTVRNDYSQRFVDTGIGQLPSNAVRNPFKATRFAEYPKLRRLIEEKASLMDATSIVPTYLQADLLHSIKAPSTDALDGTAPPFHLINLLPIKYDVVIIDPPLEAYEWESTPSGGKEAQRAWSWEQLAALPIPQIVAKESFVFLWVGSGASDGLERGREVLMRWGYRRCEDIVWIRTDTEAENESIQPAGSSTFSRTAQHCLMGIRGTIRRSTDTRFVHCNIDTDVILWPGETAEGDDRNDDGEGKEIDVRSKPPEMMDLIENFCLGTRRLELFGRNRNLRRGWLTVGLDVGPDRPGWMTASTGTNACAASPSRGVRPTQYDKSTYDAGFFVDKAGCSLAERSNLVPFSEEIDSLRPRSPRQGASNDRREQTGRRTTGGVGRMGASPSTTASPLVSSFSLSTPPGFGFDHTYAGAPPLEHRHPYGPFGTHFPPPSHAASPTPSPGGAGLSGLGAGGRSVVSVPSGSELLSGAQASVLSGQGHSSQRGTVGPYSSSTPVPSTSFGPSGLSRRGKR